MVGGGRPHEWGGWDGYRNVHWPLVGSADVRIPAYIGSMKKSIHQLGRDAELKKQANTLYKQGLPLRRVAALIGRSHEWVRQCLDENVKDLPK